MLNQNLVFISIHPKNRVFAFFYDFFYSGQADLQNRSKLRNNRTGSPIRYIFCHETSIIFIYRTNLLKHVDRLHVEKAVNESLQENPEEVGLFLSFILLRNVSVRLFRSLLRFCKSACPL